MRILLLEDEIILAVALQLELEAAGHEVVATVAREDEAIAAVEAAGSLDLLVSDMGLENDEDGAELARRLHALSGVPVLLLSGERDLACRYRDFALGFVARPHTPSVVVEAVAAVEQLLAGGEPPRLPRALHLF